MNSLPPVARTAYYCCLLRATDAEGPNPLCGDRQAALFLDPGMRNELAPLLRFRGPSESNVARHRLVDDLAREAITARPGQRFFLIGAGFDTRAFRLPGGQWWEFDDPGLLAVKELRLPADQAPNLLVRVGVDFAREGLAAHLAPLAGDDEAMVILEGVSMYLPDEALTATAAAVRRALPRATLVCDLMTGTFNRRFGGGIRRELGRLGARFAPRAAHPRLAIEAAGFRVRHWTSIVNRAREAGRLRIPAWLLATLLRELRDGYAVWVFEPNPEGP